MGFIKGKRPGPPVHSRMTDPDPKDNAGGAKPRRGDREPGHGPAAPNAWAYPVYELTVPSVRELDRRATEEYGIPGLILMENAARNLREHALEMLRGTRSAETLVLCGPGNNGGDGLALARHLSLFGVPVAIVLLGRPGATTDAGVNLGICERMGLDICGPGQFSQNPPGLVVDALFGTGLTRPPDGVAAELIEWTNHQRAQGSLVLSVDVPSGLDAQTGRALGDACVRAHRTVTLAAVKTGLTRLEAQPWLGDLAVADIGAPATLLAELGSPWKGFRGENRSGSTS